MSLITKFLSDRNINCLTIPIETYLLSYYISERIKYNDYLEENNYQHDTPILRLYLDSIWKYRNTYTEIPVIQTEWFEQIKYSTQKYRDDFITIYLFILLASTIECPTNQSDVLDVIDRIEKEYKETCSVAKNLVFSNMFDDFNYVFHGNIDFQEMKKDFIKSVSNIKSSYDSNQFS